MKVYQGDFARLYDLFHGQKPYDEEVEFTDALLRARAQGESKRLLDIACGTGQHAVRFAARGWDVVGIDQSSDMLEVARERSQGMNPTFVQRDMRTLDLTGQAFDASVCLFDSIGYGVTDEAILATLSAIREVVRDRGLLVLEFWHASAMLRRYDPVRVREWETAAGTVLRVSRTTLDEAAHVAHVEYSIYELGRDGTYSHWAETHENRFFVVSEMERFLRAAGFDPLASYAGFQASGPVDESTWHVVTIARASARGST
jgi:ubiquinone/menaquinone biosynthesis C-methylase UbiE